MESSLAPAAYPRGQTFQTLIDQYEYLPNGESCALKLFIVEGRVCKKRKMSKTLFFFEIIPLELQDKSDEFCPLQIVFEASEEQKKSGLPDSFVLYFTLLTRELHFGDVVRVQGSPQKWRTGRGSAKEYRSQLTCFCAAVQDDFPGASFDAEKYRIQGISAHRSQRPVDGADHDKALTTKTPLCRAVARGQECKNLKSCPMRHTPTENEAERTRIQLEKRKAILEAQHDPSDHSDEGKQSKTQRAEVFAKWLVDHFGIERLNSHNGVLDVAGGAGRLSFELHVNHGVKTTLVEPRSVKLSKKQAEVLKERNMNIFDHIQSYFDEDLWTDPDSPGAVSGCAVVVGLHPDQATEAIVDFALLKQKPFAIVPCCVFPTLWPDRRLRSSGRAVVHYLDFIEYLKEKDDRIKMEFLNLSGRNRVLFFDPLREAT